MKTPQKHAALIKAWADGAEIQMELSDGSWMADENPCWTAGCFKFRIKPEPKPDVSRSLCVHLNLMGEIYHIRLGEPNVELTFDGETGKLKAAEVVV